ncbi:MAG: hypothetical protein ABFD69_04665 [Candidatus Sumerlaeia bacterium]
MKILIIFIILVGLAPLASGAEPPRSAQEEIIDSVTLSVAKYYLPHDNRNTSDILVIKLKNEDGYIQYQHVNQIYTFVEAEIWWPGVSKFKDEISTSTIMEKAIMPAFQNVGLAVQNDKSMFACRYYRSLMGYKELGAAPVPPNTRDVELLARAQAPSYQFADLNDYILKQIRKLYPNRQVPIGIYILYWQDPAII